MKSNILIIIFDNEIKPHEISLFRGAIVSSLENKLLLFHNHDGDKLRYGYPLIQYKRIKGKAAILCLNKGTEDIGELFTSDNFNLKIGDREMEIHISNIIPSNFNIQIWENMFDYRISKWIPLNSENYKKYMSLDGIVERITFMEKILIGNILSFCKGIGLYLDKEVKCKIKELSNAHIVKVKNVKVLCMDVEFAANVSLPKFIGLGKHVSTNFGTVTYKKSNSINS